MDFSDIPIIYEDNHLLVVEKLVNVPSQADASHDMDMLTMLKEYIKVKYQKPGNVYLGLVHRLDRPVGGVMVFAKTSKAASRLSKQIQDGQFKKVYLAIVHGVPSKTHASLRHYLIKDTKRNMVKAVEKGTNGAKLAVLDYEVIGYQSNFSLIRINLHTGRPHQIRVQMAQIGYPLYGDQKYGLDVNKPGQQIALWSQSLFISHPTLKKNMKFNSTPPSVYPWNLFSYR
ncbi:RluA family pseudouridine synthase [Xylanivirga thermophila]|jgi:23S rRNA pseudouridine1911/1915/1917 synthase|uniref:RluA family pseudouridine synthase n=1 Tax=Xylanivirga thermophila TaxID=2496273 RepID=UPI00101CAAF4|nr:RNA pseudouridine synthase [Xylanivirga thermophila]